jgi:hypothetical protein
MLWLEREDVTCSPDMPPVPRLACLILATTLVPACGSPPTPLPPPSAITVRSAGSWSGEGNMTVGFPSDSGRFRVTWRAEAAAGGAFKLTVHSGVSGRPMQVLVDHAGPGAGTVDFSDDPRLYNLMIEATGARWSVSVDEFVVSAR